MSNHKVLALMAPSICAGCCILLLFSSLRYVIFYNVVPIVMLTTLIVIVAHKKWITPLWLAILLAGILVHWYHIKTFTIHLEPDSAGYSNWADKLKTGLNPDSTSYRPPLYSFILSLVFRVPGNSMLLVVILQHACILMSCFLLVKIGKLCNFDNRTAPLSSFLLVINSLLIQSAQMIMTEMFFMIFTLISMYVLLQMIVRKTKSSAVTTGIIFGITAHIREMLQPFFFVTCAVLIMMRKKWSFNNGVIAILVMSIVIAPWSFFNMVHFGIFSISSHFGVNIFTKCVSYQIFDSQSNVFSPVVQPFNNVLHDLGITDSDWRNPEESWSLNRVPHVLVDSLVRYHGYTFESAGRLLRNVAIESFIQNPLTYTVSVFTTMKELLFNHHELYPSLNTIVPLDERVVPRPVRSFMRGWIYVPGWFVFFFLLSGFSRRQLNYWFPFIVFVSGMLITSLVQTGLTRYSIPWIPFLLLVVSECSIRLFDLLHWGYKRVISKKSVLPAQV